MSKVKKIWKSFISEMSLWFMWIRNLFFVFMTTRNKPKVFQGYGHWWFAQRYADKRAEMSKANKVCGGKRHYVLPSGDYTLIVVNSMELQEMRSRGIIGKKFNINDVLRNAYYVTK